MLSVKESKESAMTRDDSNSGQVLAMAFQLKLFSFCVVLTTMLSGCIASEESAVASDSVAALANDNNRYADTVASSSETNPDAQTNLIFEPVGECRLSVMDEELLAKLNEVRAEERFCGDTFYAATNPVVWNCNLEGAAQRHSEDMASNSFFSHTGSDGLRVGARADAANYDWVMVGENIAVGYSSVDTVMQGWLGSPSHCRTVMNPNYQETATSLSLPSGSDYSSYWTLLMGLSSAG